MLSFRQEDFKYHFWVFGMTRPGIEPQSPRPLANTLLAMELKHLKIQTKTVELIEYKK